MNYTQLDFTKLKSAAYLRKSSESEDKQMLSIISQFDEAERIAQYYKLGSFIEIFRESKSAKKEFVRPDFMRMIEMIKKGVIDSIVCWKLDRLARNMTEGGILIDLLSSGVIKAIITHDKVYYPSDNVLLMAVEFGQGKQFVKDLSINVKRGQIKKASMGMPHGVASLGFLNDKTEEKGNRKWIVDKLKLDKIKILLDLFLTGTYSAGKLHKYAIDDLKLTTVARKRTGGQLIVQSRIYEILKDPIYAGFFIQGGERYELDLTLPRLITEDQHKKIIMLLSKKNIPKVQEHKTIYSGFITSLEGNFMGQDVKYQLICDCKFKFAYRSKTHCPKCNREIENLVNPKYLSYTHYYDVKKKKSGIPYKTVSEEKIKEYMLSFIDNDLTFSPSLSEWSKKYINELKDREINEKLVTHKSKEERRAEFEKHKARSREMLRDKHISLQEYNEDIASLNDRYSDINEEVKSVDWYSEMNEIVDLTQELKETLNSGSVQSQRVILSRLGSNLVWNDENLNIINRKSVNTLIKGLRLIRSNYPKFEPKNYVINKGSKEKTEPNDPVFSILLRR